MQRFNLGRYALAVGAVAGIALIVCLAFGWGNYALAPDGKYADRSMEEVSHDWHRYLWFFQVYPTGWPLLIVLGAFIGIINALVVVPIVCVACAVLFRLRPGLGEWLLKPRAWLWLVILGVGYASGVIFTIVTGTNPGIP